MKEPEYNPEHCGFCRQMFENIKALRERIRVLENLIKKEDR